MDVATSASAWLESAEGRRTALSGSCLLGRSAGCEVVVRDAKASRQHAMIHGQEPGEFWLVDLGSANGTYLNGRRVSQPSRLFNGDQIAIAGLTFTFHRPETPARTRADSAISEATIHDVRHVVCWLLVADIEGSTQLLLSLPPAEAPRITGRWFAACRKTLEQHHGTINKFLGDGFLAYWRASPEAMMAVKATLTALKEMQTQGNPPFRLVLHYGQVSLGGTAFMGEEGMSGPEVNFIFRMEKLAGSLGAPRLLSEAAQSQIKSLLAVTAEGNHALAGFDGQFAFFSF